MKTSNIDFIIGISFQVACLFALIAGAPSWIVPISIFGGMWFTVGIYRHIYNYIKKRWLNSKKESEKQ